MPYRLVDDRHEGDSRTLTYTGVPSGVIPVRIPDGAQYSFVEIPGLTAVGSDDWFYNGRLQMADIGQDRVLLVEHRGGDLIVHLRRKPPGLWRVTDLLADSLDHTLLYGAQTGFDWLGTGAAVLALAGLGWRMRRRRRGEDSLLIPAALVGVGAAALYALYAWVRLNDLTITSKRVEFSPLAMVSIGLLTVAGAFLFLTARSWRGSTVALALVTFPAWTAGAFSLAAVAVVNLTLAETGLGVSLYNYHLALLAGIAFSVELVLFGSLFWALGRWRQPGFRTDVSE